VWELSFQTLSAAGILGQMRLSQDPPSVAYNLGNLWLVKTGGRLVKHACALLLVAAGRRTSEPAAVRGDARPIK